jgi:hypothetical protein
MSAIFRMTPYHVTRRVYSVWLPRCGRGAELADPFRAALILIIGVPARPSRLSRRSLIGPQRANSKIPGRLAICQSTTGVATTAAALSSVEISFRAGDESNFCSNVSSRSLASLAIRLFWRGQRKPSLRNGMDTTGNGTAFLALPGPHGNLVPDAHFCGTRAYAMLHRR